MRARVRMEAEVAATPADEHPDREIGDHEADRSLRRLLGPLWQKAVEEDDGEPEADQRRRVADAPGKPELPGSASRALLAACDERRDRCEVIRVRRVAEPEEDRDRKHDHERPAVGNRCDSLVEAEHGHSRP